MSSPSLRGLWNECRATVRGLERWRCCMAFFSSAFLAFGLYHVHSVSGITEGGVLGMTLDGMLPTEEESAPESAPASESGSVSAASAAD